MSIDQIASLLRPTVGTASPTASTRPAGDFAASLNAAVNEVNAAQVHADDKLAALASGDGTDLHGTMIALQEADITLRTMVSVRDKAVEAYQQIMNMSI